MTVLVPLDLMNQGFGFAGALVFTLLLYLVILTHELGHSFAGWRVIVPSVASSLSPLGGLAHMQERASTPQHDMFISAAGPATHLMWLALTFGLQSAFGEHFWTVEGQSRGGLMMLVSMDQAFFQLNLWLMVFNLLPFYPMDGGRILGAALSLRGNDHKAQFTMVKVGIVGAALFIVAGFFPGAIGGPFLFIIGISNLLVCVQTLTILKTMGAQGYRRREPWEMDSEAWRRGANPYGREEVRVGYFAKRKEARERNAHNRLIEEAETLEKELDRILEKVHTQGLPSLTKKEKSVLNKASEKRRKGN
jgi:Zn-dependent protease